MNCIFISPCALVGILNLITHEISNWLFDGLHSRSAFAQSVAGVGAMAGAVSDAEVNVAAALASGHVFPANLPSAPTLSAGSRSISYAGDKFRTPYTMQGDMLGYDSGFAKYVVRTGNSRFSAPSPAILALRRQRMAQGW